MPPLRVLVIGDSIALLRRVHGALDQEGYIPLLGSPGPSPMLTLARNEPDVLILECGSGLGRIERWRRAVRAYRRRRSLAVLALLGRSRGGVYPRSLDGIADLGVLPHPVRVREILHRLADRTDDADSLEQAG